MKRWMLISIGFCLSLTLTTGCDGESNSDTQTNDQSLAARRSGQKADVPLTGSCEGSCGENASNGNCSCDSYCSYIGDCCSDMAEYCSDIMPVRETCYNNGCGHCDDVPLITVCDWQPSQACYGQDFATCERQADGACGWTANAELDACLGDNTCPDAPPMPIGLLCENGTLVPITSEFGCITGYECQNEDHECPEPPMGVFICDNGEFSQPQYDEFGCIIGYGCTQDCPLFAMVMPECESQEQATPNYDDNGCFSGYTCTNNCDGATIPNEPCTGTWEPLYGNGCIVSYECRDECPAIALGLPYCPNGEYVAITDDNGCITGYECESSPNSGCTVGGCSGELCGESGELIVGVCEHKPEYACYPQYGSCERQSDGQCGWTENSELEQCLTGANQECPDALCGIYCENGNQTDDRGCAICACNPTPQTCEGACGGQADSGCWCDDSCDHYGDCCTDREEICE